MASITDLVNGEFAHLDPSVQQAAIEQAEKDLLAAPEADLPRILAAVGVETQNVKDGAVVVATIRTTAAALTQLGFKLF